jgi:transposase
MGAGHPGGLGPNGVIAAPILSDPPLSGKGPFMSAAIVPASSVAPSANITPAAAKAIDPTEARRQRGLAIAAICRIEQKNGLWIVPSQSGKGARYWVKPDPVSPTCTCDDFEKRGKPCKHIFAVEFAIRRETGDEDWEQGIDKTEPVAVAKKAVAPRPTYKQDWPAYNAAQIHEKAKFQTLLTDLCQGIPEPPLGKKGGRPPIPMADRVFAVAFKVYTTMSGRRASTDMRDARDKGHLSRSPQYSRVSRFMEDKAMTPILMGLIGESAKPLRSVESDFVVDSSGFATSRFVRWYDHKYGVVKQKYDWVKCSVMTGVTTNVVTAVEMDERYSGDCPKFKPLLAATAKNFTLREVSADAAYLSYENMEDVAALGGTPYIGFRSDTTAVRGGVLEKMFHMYNLNREEYLEHYHKRSNVETTFSMVKAKFGDSLRSKTDTAMANEALCKILCHNICCLIQSTYELKINPVFWAEDLSPESNPVVAEVINNKKVTEIEDLIAPMAWI